MEKADATIKQLKPAINEKPFMPDSDANSKKKQTQEIIQAFLPPMDLIHEELGSAKSLDDFFLRPVL